MKMCCSCSWSRWSATLIISRVLSTSLNSLNSLGYVQLEMSLTRWILLILVLCKGLINNHNITRFSQFSNWIIFLNIYCEGRRTTLCYYCVLSHTHTHTQRETQLLSYHSYEAKAPAHDSLNFRRKKATERTQNKTLWSHSFVLHRSLLPASAVVKVIRMCVYLVHAYRGTCVCVWQVLFVCVTSLYCSFCSDACTHTNTHVHKRQSTHRYMRAHRQLFIIINMSLVLSQSHSRTLPVYVSPPYGATTITATTTTRTIITY